MDGTPTFKVQAFGNYYLLDRIAVGGMAEIFKSKQIGARGFEKIVVIKKILQHLSEDPEFVEMFEDEAKIAAQLNQANIVQIYELGEVDETLYITMEFVEGKNLRDLTRVIASKGLHLSVDQVVYIMIEVLKGLDYAHRTLDSQGKELKIIHRDMSPQNIVVSYEGEVKILDFGIAKAASKISKTEAGVLKGKFSYMSPEQASGRPVDQTTDIYACGVILYELLTSKRLFKADSDIETIERVKAGIVPKPSDQNSLIPEELDKIVLKALSRQVEKRYTSAGEMLSDLTELSFEKKLNYSSKEMSAFVQSLFADSIKAEHARLRAALEQIPAIDAEKDAARTSIAFQAASFEAQQASQSSPEITVSTRKGPAPRRNLKSLLIGTLFLGSLALYILVSQGVIGPRRPESGSIPIESIETTKPPEEIQSPKAEPKVIEPVEEIIVEDETPEQKPPNSGIGDAFRDLSPPAPEAKPALPPPTEPVQVKPEKKDATNERIKLPPPKMVVAYGILNMIAPPDGYAQLIINKRVIGTVPGPRARNIRLPAGKHNVKCETPARTYSGTVSINKDDNLTISCQDLK